MSDLIKASDRLDLFRAGSLKRAISELETGVRGLKKANASAKITSLGATLNLLLDALLIKKHSNQISEIIHAIGILLALPQILEPGEVIESVSLGAGNTGRGADLETNKRIAEFTFIQWQGGPESIRQNKVFKDFYFLAEKNTDKRRELYVVGLTYPEKFFRSKRGVLQILKNNDKLGKAFLAKYGGKEITVREYYEPRKHLVELRDLSAIIPAFAK